MKQISEQYSKCLLALAFLVSTCFSICIETFAQETAVLQWANHVGGTQADVFRDIARDPSGNIITIGEIRETADFDPGPGTYTINAPNGGGYAMKMDINGNLVWAKSFQGEVGVGNVNMHALAVDGDGNSYITGDFLGTADFDPGPAVFNLTSEGTDDIFFAKLDPSGNFVWAKALPSAGAYVHSKQIAVDGDANVFLTGTVLPTTDFDPGPGQALVNYVVNRIHVFFAKYNTNGDFLWVKTTWYPVGALPQGGPGGDALALDENGNMLIGGGFLGTSDLDPGPGTFNITSTGASDAYVMKLDNNGNFLWAKSYGSTFDENVAAIKTDGTHVYVVGLYSSFATDFDPGAGETVFSGSKLYISKFDLNGNFVWARTMGGMYVMHPWLGLDAGNVYVTSTFTSLFGPADYDPGVGEYLLNADVWDVALTKLTKDGNFVWAVSVGSPDEFDTNAKPVIDLAGNIYVSGTFARTSDFDPSACVYNVTSYGQTDAFNFKFSQQTSIPPPAITSFSPGSGPVGTTVVITGANFSASPASNTVKFFNNRTATVTVASPTSLTVTVPASSATGKITVTTNCQTATSATDFIVGAGLPTITSFTPTSGLIGATVIITGTNFSTTPANNTVRFNGTLAVVTASTTTSITTTVPPGATTGTITVTVAGNTATSSTSFTVTTSPVITITAQPADVTVCAGQIATFTTAATGTTNITYRWQFSPDGVVPFADISNGSGYSNATTQVLSVNTAGNFGAGRYRCRINGDLATQVLTDAKTLIVNSVPSAPNTTGASSCTPATLTLSASGGLPGEYRWYTTATGGVPIPGEVNSTYVTPSLSVSTTYHVSINNGMCESVRSAVAGTIHAVAKPSVTTSNCTATGVRLSGPAGFSTYAWSDGSGTQVINITAPGSYALTVTNFAGCVSPPSDASVFAASFCNQPPDVVATTVTTSTESTITVNLSLLISDPDNNINPESVTVFAPPTSGATAIIDANLELIVDYTEVDFAGTDQLTIQACDFSGACTQQAITIEVDGDIAVFNALSPNGDGKNDVFYIQYISDLPETELNKVTILNRWGTVVFETANYNNTSNVFNGLSNSGAELPSGTYYYRIDFPSGKAPRTGYLSLRR